jgi:hypothetical protein
MITLDFGKPRLVLHEPRLMPVPIDGAPDRAMQRFAHVYGDWSLTITYSEWSLLLDGALLAHSESSQTTITRALGVLNGQAMSSIDVDPATAATTFAFDLGCVLQSSPAPAGSYADEPVEQWTLAQPNGMYLSMRSDRQYNQVVGSTQPDDSEWSPLPA